MLRWQDTLDENRRIRTERTGPGAENTCAIAMLRPWIDVGRVGTLVLNQLEAKLGTKELGRLARPGTFFDFTRCRCPAIMST